MPLTDKGFERLTFAEILEVLTEKAKELFGDDIDTSDNSTFGKFLRLLCSDTAENQELAELVYLSAFPMTATGVNLDRIVSLVGIQRYPATYSQQQITITGTANTVVPMGFLVSAGDIIFHTAQSYTIGSGGTVEAIVICNTRGTVGNVEIGSINNVVNPTEGVESVTHTGTEKLAEDKETDFSLRNRFTASQAGTGSGTTDSITGAILRVQDVKSCFIEENDTDQTVGTLTPHSFRCYVLAPLSAKQDIAEAIFEKKPIGVNTVGSVSSTVTDKGGGEHTIKFEWTETVPIYVKCTIVPNTDYSPDSIAEIKENIVNKLSTYANNQDVTATSLYNAIYVEGVEDCPTLTISSDGTTYVSDKIAIGYTQVARSDASYIEVTVDE